MRHKTYPVRAARRGQSLVGRYLQSAYRSGWRRLLRALGFRRPSVMRPGLWSPWRLRSWQEVVWLIRVLVYIVIIFFGPYLFLASFWGLVLWLTGQW